ncbi:MAG: ATP-binding protein [Bacteriovoracaceae bacterium]
MFIKRYLDLKKHLEKKSVLLLGPRRTGKSSFIQQQVKPDVYFNLLETETFSKFAYDPGLLKKLIGKNGHRIVCIDEIQKLPTLMDEVHSLIESDKNLRFVLTGSSAKKLKKSHTSLMAGRARQLNFLPFNYQEVKNHHFDLKKFLLYGGLPDAYLSSDPWEELKDYAGMYLTEEIQASAFVRKIENYARFLEFAALSSGQLLNFESLANDAFIPARTIKDYYQLLEETMIGYNLHSFRKKGSRKEVSTSKFYFFDNGVLNAFVKRKSLTEKTKEYGDLFEHFIFLELKAYQLLNRADWELEFWRTHTQDEVDFILGKGEVIIEVKATSNPKLEHFVGLKKFAKDHKCKRSILVCQAKEKSIEGNIQIYPWRYFLEELWSGDLISS